MNQDVKKRVSRRLKIIEGQVRGLHKKIDEDAYCIDIITQASAIRHALGSLEDVVLENHLETCVVTQMQGTGKNQDKAVSEILSVYKLAKKK